MLHADDHEAILGSSAAQRARSQRDYPGDSDERQPVHTCLRRRASFRADTAPRLGALALAALDEYAPDAATFGAALRTRAISPPSCAPASSPSCAASRSRTIASTSRTATAIGRTPRKTATPCRRPKKWRRGLAAARCRRSSGIRIKPLSNELHARSLRTLDLFVTTLVARTRERLPPRFRDHDSQGDDACARRGGRARLRRARAAAEAPAPGALRLEIMIETPQSLLAPDGTSALRSLVAAGAGRVAGAHFGTYDYTALCGITAAWQHMRHPALRLRART